MDHLTRLLLPAIEPAPWAGALALLQQAQDQTLAVSVDTLVEGVHFLHDDRPADVGHKALAVNLSDLAAMGAKPMWVSLVVTHPEDSAEWAAEFASGFLSLAKRYGVRLVALRTCPGPLNIMAEIAGSVPAGQSLHRAGARAGDIVYVTGTLGEAGVALQSLLGSVQLSDVSLADLAGRLHRPQARVEEGVKLRGIATSAIDVSDGLAADLGHILAASQVGASIEAGRLPVSAAARKALGRQAAWQAALTSGDDYELCFTVPPEREQQLKKAWRTLACPITPIGRIESVPGLRCQAPDGTTVSVGAGYEHFP